MTRSGVDREAALWERFLGLSFEPSLAIRKRLRKLHEPNRRLNVYVAHSVNPFNASAAMKIVELQCSYEIFVPYLAVSSYAEDDPVPREGSRNSVPLLRVSLDY